MRVLVVSPHPDDESVGCGGTLRKHVEAGDDVDVIFLTSGEMGGHGSPPAETAQRREAEAHGAAAVLGLSTLSFWRQPDGGLRNTEALRRKLTALLDEKKTDLVYVTHDREVHRDHRTAARLVKDVLTASKSPPPCYMFEVWTPLHKLDRIEDITSCIETKLAAIRAHVSQVQALRFDEAALGLARYRGEMHSWPGGDYAEVFARMQI